MPATAHKGAIQFGLVYIPVSLHTAIAEGGVSFNQLHKISHARIRYKKIREDTGQEVNSDEIVKGYQYEPGKYVVLTDDEIERMKTDKDKSISILQFVQRGSIASVYFDKSYYLTPDGSNKAFELLRAAMEQENVMAVARTVIGTKETMLTISPMRFGLLLETLFFMDEVKPVPQAVQVDISANELQMARMLIQNMKGSYQPELYHDTYEQKLREAISRKINGQEIVAPTERESNVVDLMEALQKSLGQQGVKRQPWMS